MEWNSPNSLSTRACGASVPSDIRREVWQGRGRMAQIGPRLPAAASAPPASARPASMRAARRVADSRRVGIPTLHSRGTSGSIHAVPVVLRYGSPVHRIKVLVGRSFVPCVPLMHSGFSPGEERCRIRAASPLNRSRRVAHAAECMVDARAGARAPDARRLRVRCGPVAESKNRIKMRPARTAPCARRARRSRAAGRRRARRRRRGRRAGRRPALPPSAATPSGPT